MSTLKGKTRMETARLDLSSQRILYELQNHLGLSKKGVIVLALEEAARSRGIKVRTNCKYFAGHLPNQKIRCIHPRAKHPTPPYNSCYRCELWPATEKNSS